jgi:hypothetical protein
MGALGIFASSLPTLSPPVGRQRSWEDLSGFINLYLTETDLLIEAAEYGSLYNPISDRQTVSVLVERELV